MTAVDTEVHLGWFNSIFCTCSVKIGLIASSSPFCLDAFSKPLPQAQSLNVNDASVDTRKVPGQVLSPTRSMPRDFRALLSSLIPPM